MLNLHDAQQIILLTKIGHSTCTAAPAIFLHLVLTVLHNQSRWLKRLSRLFYGYAALAVTGMWLTSAYFNPTEVYRYSWGGYAKGLWLCTIDALFGGAVLTLSLVLMIQGVWRGRNVLSATEYSRQQYFTLALIFLSFAPMDYIPKYGIAMVPVGSGCVLAFAAIVTYAIVKHQILDFSVAIKRTAVYSILAGSITASYLVVVLVTERLFQGFFGYRSLVANVIVGFAIALGFNPLRNIIQRFVDRWFFTKSTPALAEENERLRHEVAQSDRMKAVATLAAGMAHEIKNPLSSIKTFAEYLPTKYDDPEFREKFGRIVAQEVDRMNALVRQLLEFARPAAPHLEMVSMSRLIQDTLEFLQGTLLKQHIVVQTLFDPSDQVQADPGQLKQALLNVVLNSIEGMKGPGRLSIATVRQNGSLAIVVTDTGPGIPRKDLQRVFDPFYTTKAGGTGLGLSVVHSIIRQHGGKVGIESKEGQGTTVRLLLPVH
jgi:signal transduction histidine kinase